MPIRSGGGTRRPLRMRCGARRNGGLQAVRRDVPELRVAGVVEGMHFESTGSVGWPKDSDRSASDDLLDAGDAERRAKFARVACDLEQTTAWVTAAAAALVEAGLKG